MKKIFSLGIAVLALMFLCVGTVDAATKARTASYDKGIMGVQGLGDLSTGNTVEVDDDGNLQVEINDAERQTIYAATGNTATGGVAVVSAASNVTMLTISGSATSAGDYVLLYDAASATGTPKLEATIAVTGETYSITIPGGANFDTGIWMVTKDNAVHASVAYNLD